MGKSIKNFQVLVDETVRKLGGYWRPLSGLARLLEELGELHEVLLKDILDKEELGEELADLFIITTSIANQYCADLNWEMKQLGYSTERIKLYDQIEVPNDLNIALMRLMAVGGQIGRILNHYEGDKKKKNTEKKQRLSKEIAKFHIELLGVSKLYNIPFFSYIEQVIEKDLERDKNRFEITHDPTTEQSLANFKGLFNDSEYGTLSKLWGSYEWDELKGLEDNLKNTLPTLKRFSKVAEPEGIEGLVIEIIGDQYINPDSKRNDTIRRFLTFLNHNDRLGEIAEENFGFTTDFHITFQQQRFEWTPFITKNTLFILLQPVQ